MKKIISVGRRFGVVLLSVIILTAFAGCGLTRSSAARRASLPQKAPTTPKVSRATAVSEQQIARVVIINLTDAKLTIFKSVSREEPAEPFSQVGKGDIAYVDVEVPVGGSIILIARGYDATTGKFVGHEELVLPQRGTGGQTKLFSASNSAGAGNGIQLVPGQSMWRIEKLLLGARSP